MNENVAIGVGDGRDVNLKPVAFKGHCVYVRKCRPGEQYGEDERDRHMGGIILPQQSSSKMEFMMGADWTEWVEVLAKGENCGKPCEYKEHRRQFERARWFGDDIKVGMIAHVKRDTGMGIKISPVCEDEFFIEESWLDMYFDPGEYDGRSE